MKTSLQRVKNPTGRLDWLAASLLKRAVDRRGNPVEIAIHDAIREPLERLLQTHLGPRNRKTRQLRKYLERGNQILLSAQQRRSS